ncbi:MAG: spore coat protein [Clostridia bacterium]|nr:spore coat protein [Clostridia bacterium]
MEEKYMVNDILEGVKLELLEYQRIITETQNIRLRQEIQKIRNEDEAFQNELFKISQVKGYSKEPQKANKMEINQIKTELEN